MRKWKFEVIFEEETKLANAYIYEVARYGLSETAWEWHSGQREALFREAGWTESEYDDALAKFFADRTSGKHLR